MVLARPAIEADSRPGQAGCGSNARDTIAGIEVEDRLPPATNDREAAATVLVAPKLAAAVGEQLAVKAVAEHDRSSRVQGNANGNGGGETAIPVGRAVRAVRNRSVAPAAGCDGEQNADVHPPTDHVSPPVTIHAA